MKNIVRTVLLFGVLSSVLASCASYEVMHYKGNELDKVGSISDYKVYLHNKGSIYQMDKPSIGKDGITGTLSPVTDPDKAKEIRNPSTPGEIRKHKHDLNITTKTPLKDSTGTVAIKKADITDVGVTVSKSSVNWKDIGNGVATGVVTALCLASIAGIIYAFKQ
jgi:hypothetical protein